MELHLPLHTCTKRIPSTFRSGEQLKPSKRLQFHNHAIYWQKNQMRNSFPEAHTDVNLSHTTRRELDACMQARPNKTGTKVHMTPACMKYAQNM